MRKVLTKLEIPDKVEIKGVCQPMDGRITIDKEPYGRISGAVIKITIDNKIKVNGVDINFISSYSHTLTQKEMDELMLTFNNITNTNTNN